MSFSFLFEFILLTLLISVIFFCITLSKKMKKIGGLHQDLPPFMKQMVRYTENITSAIDGLKKIVDSNEKTFDDKLPNAHAFKNDFDVLIEHAEKLSLRLDNVIEKARYIDDRLNKTLQKIEYHHQVEPYVGSKNHIQENQKEFFKKTASSLESAPVIEKGKLHAVFEEKSNHVVSESGKHQGVFEKLRGLR